MRLTRFEHSAFMLSADEQQLVVDPGVFTPALPHLSAVSAVFVSHAHPDHLDEGHLSRLREDNPSVAFLGPQQVADALDDIAVTVVHGGERVKVGPFGLEFVGSTHAEILASIPRIQNIGMVVDNLVFYPGDSYSPAPGDVDVLVVPAAAPWLRIADLEEYVGLVRPRRIVPVHTGVLSPNGLQLTRSLVTQIARNVGAELIDLQPGEHVDL